MRTKNGTDNRYLPDAFGNAVSYGTENRADPLARGKGFDHFAALDSDPRLAEGMMKMGKP